MASRGNPNWEKGKSGNPNGRPEGSKNRNAETIKAYYIDLINGNLDNIQGWLDRTAETDPRGALDFLIKLSPFVVPKKTETDMSIDTPLNIIIPEPPKKD